MRAALTVVLWVFGFLYGLVVFVLAFIAGLIIGSHKGGER